MSELRFMDRSGDSLVATWDVVAEVETILAKEKFDSFKKQGCASFDVSEGKNNLIHEFDPNAEKILLMMPIVGG